MVAPILKRVLIDNYKIFNSKQEVDFSVETASTNGGKYFTLVGENGCGKSTFLALAGLASDFGGRISNRVCGSSRESIVACEYEVKNWKELGCVESKNFGTIYPAFQLWFLDGILKIPKKLHQFLADEHLHLVTSPSTVVIGFKHTPSSDGLGEAIASKFLYVKSGGQITALIQPFNQNAQVAIVDSWVTEDLLHWSPDPSALITTQYNFVRCSTPVGDVGNPIDGVKPKHPQTAVILALRNTQLPAQSRDTIWNEVIELFHKLTGDARITVVYDPVSNSIHMRQRLGSCDSIRDDLPEGFFHAFVVAFLVINPLAKTVLLDEPTRGMHPLQIRRLERILSQNSCEKDKVIVVATHAPDMVHTSRISRIFRFQRLDSGYTEIRRVSHEHSYRDMRFISSLESRELFFTRRIIWVEGDTDRRFCDAILKLIDEGNEILWNVLVDPRDRVDSMGYRVAISEAFTTPEDITDEEENSSMDDLDYGVTGINPLQNLFASPPYEKKYFRENHWKSVESLREIVAC